MSVRLKCLVSEKKSNTSTKGGEEYGSVTLVPITSGSDENKEFYKWTPGGRLEFGTVNQKALDYLKLGSEVYIDITVIE